MPRGDAWEREPGIVGTTIMRRHFVRAAALCGAVLLGACDDDALPSGPGPVVDGVGGAQQAPRAVARFGVEVRANGSFRPGQPIQIVLNARGNLRTTDAEVRLVLPEAAALRGGGGRMHMHVGDVPVPDLLERVAMGRGQSLTRTANVTFSSPGYYQVIATVQQRSAGQADEQDPTGVPSSNIEHDVIWLWVAESGGAATDDFEPARIPRGMHVVPGPLTPETEPRPGAGDRATGPAGPRPSASVSPRTGGPRMSHSGYAGYVDTHATYANQDAGGAQTAIPNARYEYYIYKADGTYVETRTGTTAADGTTYTACYTDPVTGAYGRYRLRVFLESDRLVLSTPMAIDVGGYFSTDCGRVMLSQAATQDDRMRSHVYANLDRDIRQSDAFFGAQRPKITVRVEPAAYSTYDWHSTQQLIIDTTTDTTYPTSQVWGYYGQFVQAHEYGHAFQYHLEPTVKQAYYYDCPNPHDMNISTYHGCALAEGFPDYYAVAVAGSYTGYYLTDIESGRYSPASPANGSRTEGAVASFLYDLTDPANETHDQTAYSGFYLAEVLRTCEVYVGGAWVHQRGSDHLVYCLMNAVTDASQFSRISGGVPTAVREGATEPEASATRNPKIRKNYQKNLFGTTV
jgi:hypothetical protein